MRVCELCPLPTQFPSSLKIRAKPRRNWKKGEVLPKIIGSSKPFQLRTPTEQEIL